MPTQITIKPMQTAPEIEGKAHVHYQSWQETYKDLMDPTYLANITPGKCLAMAKRFPDNTLIAKDGDRVVGFCGYGQSRDEDAQNCGEIFGIYLLEEYQKQGIGYALMNAAMECLKAYPAVSLWVLRGNDRAIPFYLRYGFRFDGTEKQVNLGTPATELRMTLTR